MVTLRCLILIRDQTSEDGVICKLWEFDTLVAGGEGAGVWEKGQSLGWTQCSSDIVLLVELKPTNKNLEEDLRQSRRWRMKWKAMLTA